MAYFEVICELGKNSTQFYRQCRNFPYLRQIKELFPLLYCDWQYWAEPCLLNDLSAGMEGFPGGTAAKNEVLWTHFIIIDWN